jgi:transposase
VKTERTLLTRDLTDRLGVLGHPLAVGNTRRRLSFFVMVLAFSRQMFLEFTISQTMEHFLSCHEHAFLAFGGVPSKIMVDNLKSAVLQRLAGVAPLFNPRYLDFARHHASLSHPALSPAPMRRDGSSRV